MPSFEQHSDSLSCSVVIRCYNEERHIGRLLHGLLQQSVKKIDIIIVDSGSTDNTLSIARRYPVKILSIRPEDFSFGRSLNIGCNAAKENFIIFASAHVYPLYKTWIEELLTAFNDSKVGLVYGRQQGGKNTKFSEHQVFSKWFPDKSSPYQDNPFCNNANAATRKELWRTFNYNEDLTGLEDLDYANRIMRAGYRIAYNSNAVVVHLHDEKFSQIFNRYRREAFAFKHIFPDENFHFKDFLKLFLVNTLSDYRNVVFNGAKSRDIYEIPYFRLMQFTGTYQGFKERGSITSKLKQTFYYPNHNKPAQYTTTTKSIDPLLIDYQNEKRHFRDDR